MEIQSLNDKFILETISLILQKIKACETDIFQGLFDTITKFALSISNFFDKSVIIYVLLRLPIVLSNFN